MVGAVLADPRRIPDVAAIAHPGDLRSAPLSVIFAAVLELDAGGRKIDTLTLATLLQEKGLLEAAGGLAALSALDTQAPSAANAVEYARIVADKARRRRLIQGMQPLVLRALGAEGATDDLVAAAHTVLAEIGDAAAEKKLSPVREAIDRTLGFLDQSRNHSDGVTGLPSGLKDLDKLLTGFHPGELLILAARPGCGKTACGMQWALHITATLGYAAAVFSLEMPADQLALRLLASRAKVSLKRLRQGGLSDFDMGKINTEAAAIYNAPLYIGDSGSLNLLELRAQARQLKQQRPDLAIIIIDYLQLMSGDRAASREQEVGQISRGLKQLAKELGVPVLALAQLNRKVEERKGGKPMLSDLRESGCLAGDTLIPLADGRRVPIRDLVGQKDAQVWTLNTQTLKLERAPVTNAFSTGIKSVFRLTTGLGRQTRATANHPFLTPDGWMRLDELRPGHQVAVAPLGGHLSVGNVVRWDLVAAIQADGEEEVFDLTVPPHSNFVAADVVVHNSLEQDADVVMFLHPDPPKEGEEDQIAPGCLAVDLVVAKQRNGPADTVRLLLQQEFVRFELRERHYDD